MPVTSELFQTIPCPLCGAEEFTIIRKASYPESITAKEISNLYSASSSHELMDQVVQCRKCEMQYLNPRPNPEIIVSGYSDAVDPTFVAQNPQRIRTFEKSLRSILDIIGMHDGKGKRLLDVGCAGGAFPVAARTLGFDATGIEPSHWMADYGRKTYGVDIRDGLLERGIYPNSSFDVISLWDVLEHVPDPNALLTLIHDLLRPKGVLLVNYPDIGSIAAKVMGNRWPFWLSVHLLYYDRKTIRRQLSQCKFNVLTIRPYWQALELAYLIDRAKNIFAPAGVFKPLVNAVGLGKTGVTYNMGQTLVICRK